ncbi:MAG: UDP-N-acetylglucosamine--N-acetylmuramyl-(pentapeptide) pyrophosphoryl-undecaprenol N-acetylglucosamine transferase, partial [Nitrospirae bacterium]|nr:UDP-N-acetylglucosamine--N-acetylmuramyl-(pentapeptide) pyrophosphoryl-undecaprenol N-acetylglucosamine transferase [Nitrospirota bacterium]
PFIYDMAKAYESSDLVVCRAGATTLAELSACGKPAILIPFPFAAHHHQEKNAHFLKEMGAA